MIELGYLFFHGSDGYNIMFRRGDINLPAARMRAHSESLSKRLLNARVTALAASIQYLLHVRKPQNVCADLYIIRTQCRLT